MTVRKSLRLFANIGPAGRSIPSWRRSIPAWTVVIVRENEEDLYAGIVAPADQRSLPVPQADLAGRAAERIVRHAFEYARANVARKCFLLSPKDNIMKLNRRVSFTGSSTRSGEEYPDIEKEHWIVDIGAAKLADARDLRCDRDAQPLWRLLSDGGGADRRSVGLAGSANIGEAARHVRGDPRLRPPARRPGYRQLPPAC